MAIAVAAAMFSIACVPAGVGAVVGFVVARRRAARGLARPSLRRLTLAGFAVGFVAGLLGLVFTFYEGEVVGPKLVFEVPPGFEHHEIFVVEDPTSSVRLQWNEEHELAVVSVPPSGVVRVTSLEGFAGGPLDALLDTGGANVGGSSRPPPSGIPGRSLLCFEFTPPLDAQTDGCGPVRSAEWIRSRELSR